jgi:hypothetical protein
MNRIAALALAAALGLGVADAQADGIRRVEVHFPKGATGATLKDRLKGDETVDYRLGAKAGQTMTVTMKTDNASAYFNVLPPGSQGEAVFVGSTSGERYEGALSADGVWTIRVYLMRNAARRGEAAHYTLDVAVAAAAAAAPASDAKVPGTDFHATGEIPCAVGAGAPMGSCRFGVTREGAGAAIVTVFRPDGRPRIIIFQGGEATGADIAQSEGDIAFKASRAGDLTTVTVGAERYEIPDAVPLGG